MSFQCSLCGDEEAAFVCACDDTYYCSEECQRDDWSEHKAECQEMRARDVDEDARQALVVGIHRRREATEFIAFTPVVNRNIVTESILDILQTLTGEVESGFLSKGQKIGRTAMFVRILENTDFWQEFSTKGKTRNLSAFVPTSESIFKWARDNGFIVLKQILDREVIQIGATVDNIRRNAAAMTILLSHIVPGIWPYPAFGFDPPPGRRLKPDPAFFRRGMEPLLFDSKTLSRLNSRYFPDNDFRKSNIGRVRIRKEEEDLTRQRQAQRQQQVLERLRTEALVKEDVKFDEEKALDTAQKASNQITGFWASFSETRREVELPNDEENVFRVTNGYVYVVNQVLLNVPEQFRKNNGDSEFT